MGQNISYLVEPAEIDFLELDIKICLIVFMSRRESYSPQSLLLKRADVPSVAGGQPNVLTMSPRSRELVQQIAACPTQSANACPHMGAQCPFPAGRRPQQLAPPPPQLRDELDLRPLHPPAMGTRPSRLQFGFGAPGGYHRPPGRSARSGNTPPSLARFRMSDCEPATAPCPPPGRLPPRPAR